MGQAVRRVRCKRDRAFCRHRVDGETDGTDQTAVGRWEDFVAGMDFSEALSTVGFTDQCIARLCDRLHSFMASADVDSLFAKDFYKDIVQCPTPGRWDSPLTAHALLPRLGNTKKSSFN